MTRLLLVSKLTEARKFSRDDRLRSGTPGPEAARLKTPALSSSLALISVVVVHRRADGARLQSALTGVTMKETVAQKRKGASRPKESELTLAPQNGNAPDPRLIEFVRLLARRGAQERYEQLAQEHRSKRS